MIVTIMGAGNMARGITTRALAGGNSVRLVDVHPERADSLASDLRRMITGADVQSLGSDGIEGSDVVVLALPYPAGREVVAEYGSRLVGPAVVDISNPVNFETLDSLTVPPGTSAAEQIAAAAAPGVQVVKAFNTTFAATLVVGEVAGHPLDVFIAGDYASAKGTVSELVSGGGLRPLDVGGLRHARELETLQLLHMSIQDRLRLEWRSGIKILS